MASLAFLTLQGVLVTYSGGASMKLGALGLIFWGALAMASTAGVGRIFGVVA